MSSSDFIKGSDEIYRCQPLQELAWVDHGFTTRASAASVTSMVSLRQTHSATVWNARGLPDRAAEGDALITDDLDRRIAVRTADCVPILIADRKTRAVAAIHAGWRGTAARIAGNAVQRMVADFGSDPADLVAAIGPAINVCCYEVGEEVARQFKDLLPPTLMTVTGSKAMLDLPQANRRILTAEGLCDARIYLSGLCTACLEDDFVSYRRDPSDTQRMVSFIGRTA